MCSGTPSLVQNPRNLKDNDSDDLNGGGGCLGHLPPYLVMHALCMLQQKQQRSQAKQRREGDRPDRPRRTKKESPKPEGKTEGGWVRIRDLKHPRIHTPPQPRPSVPRPLPGRSGPLLLSYVAISPLSGSAFHIFKLHFCKCIRPLPGIVAANGLQHFRLGSVT